MPIEIGHLFSMCVTLWSSVFFLLLFYHLITNYTKLVINLAMKGYNRRGKKFDD